MQPIRLRVKWALPGAHKKGRGRAADCSTGTTSTHTKKAPRNKPGGLVELFLYVLNRVRPN
ncbi:MAG: hypothetical protein EA353_02205 [Puniceicoccaceae bacterium]|nr:MAG: hypothetical protein EA353_02205 [Puniceicoccaceae bacterium]